MEEWNNPEFAGKWDADTVSYNPTRLEQIDMLLSVLEDEYRPGTAILDVGMGSGRIEEMLFKRLPGAFVVGTDFSEPMLAIARKRLEPYSDRYEAIRQDLTDAQNVSMPEREYSAALSVQVIHNVAHPHKKETFAFVHDTLMPGGIFLLLDRIRVDTPGLFGAYNSLWKRLDRLSSGGTHVHNREGGTYQEHEESVSRRGDKPATLEEHLRWLREAGFSEVACLNLYNNRALFAARKAATGKG